MTSQTEPQTKPLGSPELQWLIDQFYYQEAALLDDHNYDPWLALFAEDCRYWMPIRQTTSFVERSAEFTAPGEMAFIDDDRAMLDARVRKFATGFAWAEDPPSRTRHLFTNIRILAIEGSELVISSNFILYRTRLEHDVDWWVGRREDRLRQAESGFQIVQRAIFLDQTNLLSKNLSNFF